MDVLISIVIPTYNVEAYIEDCLNSVYSEVGSSGEDIEIIVVDDYSTDDTVAILKTFQQHANFRLVISGINVGPGVARNHGVAISHGKYILFLDGDDQLSPGSMGGIRSALCDRDVDILAYDWTPLPEAISNNTNLLLGYRRDFGFIEGPRQELIKAFLSMSIDGSVIYTMVRKQLLVDNDIKFQPGFFEDIPYIFQVYWFARSMKVLKKPIYLKRTRDGSILQTISSKHFSDYLESWRYIWSFVECNHSANSQDLLFSFQKGIRGIFAILILKILRSGSSTKEKIQYLYELGAKYKGLFFDIYNSMPSVIETKYDFLFENFLKNTLDHRHESGGMQLKRLYELANNLELI